MNEYMDLEYFEEDDMSWGHSKWVPFEGVIQWVDPKTIAYCLKYELQFTEADYGIHDLRDIPIPFGIETVISNITKNSIRHIEILIQEIPFLPFEYTWN